MATRIMNQALTTPADHDAVKDEPALSQDDIFHLLQVRRRRDALRYLKEHDGPVRMRDLAEQVAAWEHDTTVRELRSAQRQRVYIPLYQTHLPKLDDAGVIEYQQSRGIVERAPLADVFDPYLHGGNEVRVLARTTGAGQANEDGERTAVNGDEHPAVTAEAASEDGSRDWTRYYMGASGLGLALVGGSVVGLPAISTLSGTALGTLVSGLFAALTTAHSLDIRSASHAR